MRSQPKQWNAEVLKLHERFVSGKHPMDSNDPVAAEALAPSVEQAVSDASATAEFQQQRKNMLRKMEVCCRDRWRVLPSVVMHVVSRVQGHKRHAEVEELKVADTRRRAVAENSFLVEEARCSARFVRSAR